MFPIITSLISLHMIIHKMHTRYYNYITLIHSSFCALSSKSFERRPNSGKVWAVCCTWSRGQGTFEMLIHLASAGRAAFPQEHATRPTPSLKWNITHTIAGGVAKFIGWERVEWGQRVMTITGNRENRETRDTRPEHEKREIQGPNIAGNARYRKRTRRKKKWRWRNRASRATWDRETGRGENRDTEERTLATGTRRRQRADTDLLFPRLLST